jgi:protein-tyrosine phosphatase
MTLYPEQDLYSEILPGLWQGGTHDFDTLEFPKQYPIWNQENEFDCVATLYAVAHPVGWGISERRFGFPDSALDEENLPEIHAMADWVYSEWKLGKKVLVRCQAGWNRSGLVTALALMKDGRKAKDAIDLIRARRSPHALCNADFVRYLEDLSRTKRPSAQSKTI